MNTKDNTGDVGNSPVITCASCQACCCRLEVMLMGEDDIPVELTEQDRWGGWVMARLDDGWCAALDRATMLCTIYERRPMICRDYQVGDSDCVGERLQGNLQILEGSCATKDAVRQGAPCKTN